MANIEDIAKQSAAKNKQVKKKVYIPYSSTHLKLILLQKDYDDYELSLGSDKDDEVNRESALTDYSIL